MMQLHNCPRQLHVSSTRKLHHSWVREQPHFQPRWKLRYACRAQASQQQTQNRSQSVQQPAQQQQRQLPSTAKSVALQRQEFWVLRSQLAGKTIITRKEGNNLGTVTQIWVDPYTLRVAGLTSERWHGISESEKNSLPLRTLRQISDVILVDSAAAALYQAPPAAMRLVGLPVKTAAGTTLGKVRDFVFSPDSGRIGALRFDALGLPSLPDAFLTCKEVGMQDVQEVTDNAIVLYAYRENAVQVVGRGVLDGVANFSTAAVEVLQQLAEKLTPEAPVDDMEKAYDEQFAEWYEKYGSQYRDVYGRDPPMLSRMAGKRQAPLSLPPPQQSRMQLQVDERPAQPQYAELAQPAPAWQEQQFARPAAEAPPQYADSPDAFPQPSPPSSWTGARQQSGPEPQQRMFRQDPIRERRPDPRRRDAPRYLSGPAQTANPLASPSPAPPQSLDSWLDTLDAPQAVQKGQ